MNTSHPSGHASATRSCPASMAAALRRLRPRGLSVILIAVVLLVLIGFVSLSVDYGRVKLAKAQLQTAADAAAMAGGTALTLLPNGVGEAQERAYDAAAKNFNIDVEQDTGKREDHQVELVVDEDVEFGIWRPSAPPGEQFQRLIEDNGGIDERRKANAIRAWGRRVTTYTDPETGAVIPRNNALPLIFAPVLPDGPLTGDIETRAIVRLLGGSTGYGFIGLEEVRFNGTTKTDSYNAQTEDYPGADGVANHNSAISSNGDIRLVGTTDIYGDVHPGVDGDILPIPLGGNVTVTGHMHPLSEPLVQGIHYDVPLFQPPTTGYNLSGDILPTESLAGDGSFRPNNKPTTIFGRLDADHPEGSNFVFKSWTTKANDMVLLNNSQGPINIWVRGNFVNGGQAVIKLESDAHRVTLWIDGNFDMQGGGVLQEPGSTPSNFVVNVTKPGTRVDIGGSPNVYMHLNAPLSDITLHGHGNTSTIGFYGWAIGKTLTVNGNFEAHYDETREVHEDPYTIKMVR